MVGRVWSEAEERYFWRTAVENSQKRTGINRAAKKEKSWDDLAREMKDAMGKVGPLRRSYTGTGLFEHYFQNIEGQRTSPNAIVYVNEYKEKKKIDNGGMPMVKSRARAKPKTARFRAHIRDRPSTDQETLPAKSIPNGGSPLSTETAPASTSDGFAITSPSPSDTTLTPVENRKERHSTITTRRLAKVPRPLREIMPAPKTGRVTKSSTPTRFMRNDSLPTTNPSTQWGYQMGKLPDRSLSSNQASVAASCVNVPTQPATSSFPAQSYAATSTMKPPALNPFKSPASYPNTSESLPRGPRSVAPYPYMGNHMGQQGMMTQPLAFNYHQGYPANFQGPYQAIGKTSPAQYGAPYQNPYYQMGAYAGQPVEQLAKQPLQHQMSDMPSPDMYSAASILSNLTTSRPGTTQCFPAQARIDPNYNHNNNWNQQPGYVQHAQDSYERTSTGPNASHFQLSPPAQAIREEPAEESLFVEDDSEQQSVTVSDASMVGNSPESQVVLESIEVSSTKDGQTNGSTKGKEKADDYAVYRQLSKARSKKYARQRRLNEWVDYSSESLDYDDVNDGDYVPGMSLSG